MTYAIPTQKMTETILFVLDEAFNTVHGVFLDPGTSLFETLATITAIEASQPVSPTCATLAAQVEHVQFYLDTTLGYMQGALKGKTDWKHIWETVNTVSAEEWEAIKMRLQASYEQVVAYLMALDSYENEDNLYGALSVVIHTAYHLGEIRQALCTLKTEQ